MRNIGDIVPIIIEPLMSNFKMNVGYVNVYLKDATTRAIKHTKSETDIDLIIDSLDEYFIEMIQKNENYIKKYSIEVRCIDISNGLETDMFSLVWLDGLDNLNQNIVFKKLKSKEGFFNAR